MTLKRYSAPNRRAGSSTGRKRHVLIALIAVVIVASVWTLAYSTATTRHRFAADPLLRINISQPGNIFEPGAVGLSTEASELGSVRLGAADYKLTRLMRLLGPSVLRIGGSSVDSSWWTSGGEAAPSWATTTVTPADLIALDRLLVHTGWRVLLGVNFGHFEPARVADEAHYAETILGSRLLGIEIGNEPNDYHEGHGRAALRPPNYSLGEYQYEAEAYRQALDAAAPGIALYGPASSGGTTWLTRMGSTAAIFTELTQHYYPAACPLGPQAVSPPTVPDLLSPTVRSHENETLSILTQARSVAGRPLRIGETGSGPCGGNSYASPTFASALWALDWTLRAISGGVTGLNFHGHLTVCGSYTQSPICSKSVDAAEEADVRPQAEYYGILAASRLEGGHFVPTEIDTPIALPNLTTWATVASNGTVKVAVDNLATTGSAQLVSIHMPGYTSTEETLMAPSAYARNHLTFGGSTVTAKGQWEPKPLTVANSGGIFRIAVHPASAVIVILRP
jgi:hypothetical protein